MSAIASTLARWAAAFRPSPADEALARRALVDTVAVALASRDDPLAGLLSPLGRAGRWAAIAHVLDFDDLHMPSTTHVSAVCVPVALATGGGARAYLAGAGVMARLGTALGWPHYARGWHATCTAGAPGAAACAAAAMGADADGIATALALAVPAAGGVQRAFGTAAKSLQVGFAADAGVRAAELAAAGATADPLAVDQWLALVGGDRVGSMPDAPAVPDGLAVKLFPCCYALQRPIAAARTLRADAAGATRIVVRTPEATVAPLIHDRPRTGLEGKFSLQYGVAAALLDERPGPASFTDAAVRRPEAQALLECVAVETSPGGDGLLVGAVEIEATDARGGTTRASLELPPGAPGRPPSEAELAGKVRDCAGREADAVLSLTWDAAAALLDDVLDAVRPLSST
jgi:2-methylcitrate dehydratase PrpD